ncbi:MAG TPA: alpha-L-rhamnosidase C-terminal domain-containing protein, partial [Cyclobacteriaceae bacterium]
ASSFAQPWKAVWIAGADNNRDQYEVLKFRKTFDLPSKPDSFLVHVSADNRYKLFVNGTLVSMGPARGDLMHWNFETVNIAQHLVNGKNAIAALVWNEGPMRPEAQVSLMTGFIMQGKSEAEAVVNTDASWKVIRDDGYTSLRPRTMGYYVAGQGELVTMSKTARGFETANYDDSNWKKPRTMYHGVPKGVFTFEPVTWMLVPSPLPQMERTIQRMGSVRKSDGVKTSAGYPKTKSSLTIPAKTSATLLIDNEVLTNAYATLEFSDGKDAAISMAYSEALYIPKNGIKLNSYTIGHLDKGNRNDVDGKVFVGRRDSIISDGSKGQKWESLWYRTYRYVLLKVKTADQPLVIDDIYGVFTGYPFQLAASVTSDKPNIQKNLEIGWRTARLCATETYMDCPYYEQLQYFGDTRIQCLVTMFNSKDDRLVRNAIMDGDISRFAEGVTMSRYPTASTQIIPPFSLWWIHMVHDYWMYRDDMDFVRARMPGTREVLSFFQKYQQEDGSLKNLPYWIFTDWVDSKGWKDGVAPLGANNESAILDLQLMWTYLQAADLEGKMGHEFLFGDYASRAELLSSTIKDKYWDEKKGVFADTPEKKLFSQHANALAILSGMVVEEEAQKLARKMLSDPSLAQASIYFKYYVHQAAIKAGLGNDYIKWLAKWDENIAMGLTTWAEMSNVAGSRSDCHAWGSSPNVELYRTVLGINTAEIGFRSVLIEPHLGDLTNIKGTMPHPNGQISVSYVKDKSGKWAVDIDMPEDTRADLLWNGKYYSLRAGKNSVNVNE